MESQGRGWISKTLPKSRWDGNFEVESCLLPKKAKEGDRALTIVPGRVHDLVWHEMQTSVGRWEGPGGWAVCALAQAPQRQGSWQNSLDGHQVFVSLALCGYDADDRAESRGPAPVLGELSQCSAVRLNVRGALAFSLPS